MRTFVSLKWPLRTPFGSSFEPVAALRSCFFSEWLAVRLASAAPGSATAARRAAVMNNVRMGSERRSYASATTQVPRDPLGEVRHQADRLVLLELVENLVARLGHDPLGEVGSAQLLDGG